MSKKKQEKIAEEVTEQQQKQDLLRQIRLLKRLPNDFRDIDPGSPDWEAFADITGKREEMTKWYRGPVLYFGKLNKEERMILEHPNILICIARHKKFTVESWKDVIPVAVRIEASWIYLPDEETQVIEALNIIFSRFGFNIRARGPVMSERSGQRIGVVH